MGDIPKFIVIRQKNTPLEPIKDVSAEIKNKLNSFGKESFEGMTVGITAGSRGIDCIDIILRETASYVKRMGGRPVIIAAMGSHGGGTAEGQREVLSSLNITEETVGTEIRTCAKSKYLGETESGFPVYGNVLADEFDKIIIVNRVKPHTDFEAETESGLLKVMAIGIGNPTGCKNVHTLAFVHGYAKVIQETGLFMLKRLNVAFGIALTENWQHKLNRIEVMAPQNIYETEKALLREVKEHMVKLPAKEADVLIIQNVGKDISGTCMDTKVIGRIGVLGQAEPEYPKIKRIAIMRLTEGSHGNAIGIGLADVAPMELFKSVDMPATALNSISSMCLEQGRMPCIAADDLSAISAAVETVGLEDTKNAQIMYIQDTNSLEYIAVSEPLYEELKNSENIERVSEPFALAFDDGNRLMNRWEDHRLRIV